MFYSIFVELAPHDLPAYIATLALANYGIVWVIYKKPGFLIVYKDYVPPTGGFLLMEDSGFILLEDGSRIELEQ
jgi:hypothetical protein